MVVSISRLPHKAKLMREFILKILQPGDMIVYSGTGFFSRLIKFKTASEWTHVSVYIGGGKMREFKEARGAQEVDVRIENIALIRRPKCPWDREKSDQFWHEVKDQKYDYLGLLWSFYARKQGRMNNKMFCSEFFTRDARSSTGCPAVSEETDADAVTPEDLGKTVAYTTIWMGKVGHR